jgi:phage FluMu protein Com
MPNIHLQCGHCGKTIAIAETSLGRQVRCPYCQQVVQAPSAMDLSEPVEAPSAPEAPQQSDLQQSAPVLQPLSADEQQRMFGANAEPATVSEPTASQEAAPKPAWLGDQWSDPRPQAIQAEEASTAENDPVSATNPAPFLPTWSQEPSSSSEPFATDNSVSQGQQEFAADAAPGAFSAPSTPPRRGSDSSALRTFLFWALVSYSILSTILVILAIYRLYTLTTPDPFEKMLDDGDPAAPKPDDPLSNRLRAPLDVPIRVGDLEVTASQIQRRKVSLMRNGSPTTNDALVLHLQLKNVGDHDLKPLDFQFDRRWNTGMGKTARPYTLVEMGKRIFYGGPLEGPEDPSKQDPASRKALARLSPSKQDPEGMPLEQNHDRVLKPGQSFNTWLCTDCQNPEVLQALDTQALKKGTYLWRVQVRRGQVRARQGLLGGGGEEHWATAVVGFEFTPNDVQSAK